MTEQETDFILECLIESQGEKPSCCLGSSLRRYPEAIFQSFTESGPFGQLRAAVAKPSFVTLSQQNPDQAERRLRGKMLQDIAYMVLASQLPDNMTLLSPEATLKFCRRLHPHTPVVHYPPGLSGLKGIPVPDGFVVYSSCAGSKIVGWCEYTLSNDRGYFHRKYQNFRKAQTVPGNPFGYCECVFVTPSDTREFHPRGKNGIRYKPLPFSREDFGEYVTAVSQDHLFPQRDLFRRAACI